MPLKKLAWICHTLPCWCLLHLRWQVAEWFVDQTDRASSTTIRSVRVLLACVSYPTSDCSIKANAEDDLH